MHDEMKLMIVSRDEIHSPKGGCSYCEGEYCLWVGTTDLFLDEDGMWSEEDSGIEKEGFSTEEFEAALSFLKLKPGTYRYVKAIPVEKDGREDGMHVRFADDFEWYWDWE